MNNQQTKILVQKDDKIYSFYLLKNISWAQENQVKTFNLWPGKSYKIGSCLDIFLLDNSSDNSLELVFRYIENSIRQKKYPLTPHPYLANWWTLEVAKNHLEILIDFCYTASLSHQRGEDLSKAYSCYE